MTTTNATKAESMRTYSLFLTLLTTVLVGCDRSKDTASNSVAAETSTVAPVTEVSGFYSVDDYDPARDANADLLATVEQATADNKRIIIEVGGQW